MTAEERREKEKVNIGGQDLTIDKVISLIWRYKKALEGLTAGGSEFVNDPERCAEWIRKGRDSSHNTILRLSAEKKKAYEAGRSSMQEEAAQLIQGDTEFHCHDNGLCFNCMKAAAIRALKP